MKIIAGVQIATGDRNAVANTGGFTGRMGLGDCPRKKVEAWCLEHTVEEIVAALVKADIPVAPVKTIPQVAQDPHLWEREMLVKMEDPVAGEMYLPGATIKMSKTPGRIGPVPTPGQHTDEVLTRLLGYDRATLSELRQDNVIA
jgi:crotonobetainyl-CoA:carnitine CoA-transferase CaiB-like acyl-CoA transferase